MNDSVNLKFNLDFYHFLRREDFRDALVLSAEYFSIQSFHVIGAEGWFKCDGLVHHTPQGPDVRFHIVWGVAPYLGTGVIGRPGLSVQQAVLGDLADVEIAQLYVAVLCKKHICRFEVTMENLHIMQDLEAVAGTDEDFPNVLLAEI